MIVYHKPDQSVVLYGSKSQTKHPKVGVNKPAKHHSRWAARYTCNYPVIRSVGRDTKFTDSFFFICLYGYRFLNRGFTDRRQILHGGSTASQTGFPLFWGIAPGMAEFWASTWAIWRDIFLAEARVLVFDVLGQLYDTFDTFGVQPSRRDNNHDNNDDDDDDNFEAAPRRRHRMTGSRAARPLGDMAQPSTGRRAGGLWAGWDMGQSDDGQATSNIPSSLLDAEHPMKKYRRRKKNGRRTGRRNSRNRAGRVVPVTTTASTTTTTAPPSNQVNCVCYLAPANRTKYYKVYYTLSFSHQFYSRHLGTQQTLKPLQLKHKRQTERIISQTDMKRALI